MFAYKGKTSAEMGLRIAADMTYQSPERDIQLTQIQGRDGDILTDNGRYHAVEVSIPVMVTPLADTTLEEQITAIANWLLTDINEHDFLWEHDPDFAYRALFYASFQTQRVLADFGRTVLTFRFHPIKFLADGLKETTVANNTVLQNPFGIVAKPRLRLVGSGNMTVQMGGSTLTLQGVDGGIIVDSQTQTVPLSTAPAPSLTRCIATHSPPCRRETTASQPQAQRLAISHHDGGHCYE